mmetsp:Transcript_61888/g.172834  ORF Transcript_61888/g.172834 Transcript_61888/m.172834 type:complete len:117 (+) Transcript_61888:1231-1581(+)
MRTMRVCGARVRDAAAPATTAAAAPRAQTPLPAETAPSAAGVPCCWRKRRTSPLCSIVSAPDGALNAAGPTKVVRADDAEYVPAAASATEANFECMAPEAARQTFTQVAKSSGQMT